MKSHQAIAAVLHGTPISHKKKLSSLSLSLVREEEGESFLHLHIILLSPTQYNRASVPNVGSLQEEWCHHMDLISWLPHL